MKDARDKEDPVANQKNIENTDEVVVPMEVETSPQKKGDAVCHVMFG